MRVSLALATGLLASAASAAPIQPGLTVTGFFAKLDKAAKDLAEGGMILHKVNCLPDGTVCEGYYGAGNVVTARGPAKDAGMETVTVRQVIPGETEDFWLTSALVMELLDGNFKTIPERSQLILGAMRAPGTSIVADVGRYTFDRSPAPDNLSSMVVTAK
jgi:hypothetical protein